MPTEPRVKNAQAFVSDRTYRELVAEADRSGHRSVADVVRKAIEAYLRPRRAANRRWQSSNPRNK